MYKLYVFSDLNGVDSTLLNRIIKALPKEFAARVVRYKAVGARIRSAISYLMVISALKNEFKVNDFELKFMGCQKPHLKNYQNVHFNTSHCRDACACVVADCDVGVDIQEIRPFLQKLADRVCCDAELALLAKSIDKAELFTKMWAMKESYVKKTGDGITFGLKNADTTQMKNTEVIRLQNYFVAVTV